MSPRVYVETTIPSFSYEQRPEAAMMARRDWTRAWSAAAVGRDELVTSEAVLEELERGDFEARKDCLELLTDLPLLRFDQAVMEIVDTYLRHDVMPQDPKGDALHLAVASLPSMRLSGDVELPPSREPYEIRPPTMGSTRCSGFKCLRW